MKITTVLILILILLMFPFTASAFSFNIFTTGGTSTGSINTANGYYDDDSVGYGYTGTRNVYVAAESSQIWLFEPISAAGGVSNPFQAINSSFNTIKDAVVFNGYLYFIDGTTLVKKKVRATNSVCERTLSTCALNISSSVTGRTLRVYNNALYFIKGTNSLYHIGTDDNEVFDFTTSLTSANPSPIGAFTVVSKSGILHMYTTLISAPFSSPHDCISSSCTLLETVDGSANNYYSTYMTLSNYIYYDVYSNGGSFITKQKLAYITNNTMIAANYLISSITLDNRVYVGSRSTIGLSRTLTTYDTFNSISPGIDSLPVVPVSGNVFYDAHSVSVPTHTYYNDSVIPISYNVQFYITDDNSTAFSNLMSWSIVVKSPDTVQTTIANDLVFSCTQTLPWWDALGFFRTISFGTITGSEPWACSSVGTMNYAPIAGTKWQTGGYRVDLFENFLSNHADLSFDTWTVLNQSNNVTTITNPVSPKSGIGGNPMQQQTDNFLSGGMFVALILMFIFAAAGQAIGGFSGAAVGFGGGFIFASIFGLIPTWALFLFAILVITLFAIMVSSKIVGGGEGGD